MAVASSLTLEATASPVPDAVTISDSETTDFETNESLDSLAKLFASTVTRNNVRHSIHDAVSERFDGDTEVLWETLASETAVDTALVGTYSQEESVTAATAQVEVEALVDEVPRFQVAVPENLNAWNVENYTPLVAYVPEGVDDTTLKTITAYNAAGDAIQLDAQTAPRVPVIVLGVNERTDDSGNPLPSGQAVAGRKTSTQVVAAQAAATVGVRLVKTQLIHDNEPWAKGDAEISVTAKSRGCSGVAYTDIDYTGLNNDGDIYSSLRSFGNTTCDVVFYWWEDDGGAFDFTLEFAGFGLGVHMDNDDDRIGGSQLPRATFESDTDQRTTWSDLVMWTD